MKSLVFPPSGLNGMRRCQMSNESFLKMHNLSFPQGFMKFILQNVNYLVNNCQQKNPFFNDQSKKTGIKIWIHFLKSDQKKTAYAKFKKRLLRKVPKFRFLKMLTGSKIRIKWYFVTKIVLT